MGRRLRDQLQMTSDLLKPHLVESLQGKKTRKDKTQKKYYDRKVGPPQNFAFGDKVRIYNDQFKT